MQTETFYLSLTLYTLKNFSILVFSVNLFVGVGFQGRKYLILEQMRPIFVNVV